MATRAWNLALTAVYAARSYEAGLQGARALLDLTNKFREQLTRREYEVNLIHIALLELTCLDRLDRLREYLDAWERWSAAPLALSYRLSPRNKSRIEPFLLERADASPTRLPMDRTERFKPAAVVAVHFLYVQRARKELIERKIGTDFRGHARQEDLTEEEMRSRLARVSSC